MRWILRCASHYFQYSSRQWLPRVIFLPVLILPFQMTTDLVSSFDEPKPFFPSYFLMLFSHILIDLHSMTSFVLRFTHYVARHASLSRYCCRIRYFVSRQRNSWWVRLTNSGTHVWSFFPILFHHSFRLLYLIICLLTFPSSFTITIICNPFPASFMLQFPRIVTQPGANHNQKTKKNPNFLPKKIVRLIKNKYPLFRHL